MRSFSLAAAAAVGCFAGPLSAQDAAGGTRAAPFLLQPASVEALASAGAAVIRGRSDALFAHPALLAMGAAASDGRSSASASLQPYLASSRFYALSAAGALRRGAIAVGVHALDYGDSPEILPDGGAGTPTGRTISALDLAVMVGGAYPIGRFTVGAAAKHVRQTVADESGSTVALDLGAAVSVRRAVIALAVQNLGPELAVAGRGRPLPELVRAGVRYALRDSGRVQASVLGEGMALGDGERRIAGGVVIGFQATPSARLEGRVGARGSSFDTSDGAFTGGVGVEGRTLAIDYAFASLQDVATATHRVGIRWRR